MKKEREEGRKYKINPESGVMVLFSSHMRKLQSMFVIIIHPCRVFHSVKYFFIFIFEE